MTGMMNVGGTMRCEGGTAVAAPISSPRFRFALIHSPLVGPATWQPVAGELRRLGHAADVPAVADGPHAALPFWERHARSAGFSMRRLPDDRPLVLAGHSGAGALLPLIRRFAGRPVAAYLFVDAGLPLDGVSRLDEMAASAPELAGAFRRQLEGGGVYPTWTDAELREEIPDPERRRRVVAEIRPRPLAFFAEPFPPLEGWPDAPCAYLRFSPSYAAAEAAARRRGWPCRVIAAGHFHMLADPPAVAAALVELAQATTTAQA
jgi:hypothetical protein